MTQRPWVKYYQDGVPADIELPTTSLFEMFEEAVRGGGSNVALDFFGGTTTYSELGEQVKRAAEGLRRLGVRAGDRVGLFLPNCPSHIVAFYAAIRIGAVVVEHNPLYTAKELRHLVEDHRAKVLIVWDAIADKVRDLPRDLGVEKIVAVNVVDDMALKMRIALALPIPALRKKRAQLTQKAPGTVSWKTLLAAEPISDTVPRPVVSDLAVIQYTSGTTGHPKGAMLTHMNLYANALQGKAWMCEAQDRKEVFYAVLPLFHAFGMTMTMTYGIMRQARLVLFPKPDPDLVLKEWKRHPATVYCCVPPIYAKTLSEAAKRGIDLSSARFCISGAMALTDDLVSDWEAASGHLLVEGYGMTEASPVALGNPFCVKRKTGTIGIPFPSTDMRVVDPEDPSREVPQGQPGELLIAGPQVFQGYWENPEETAKTLLSGGWLRTGDIVVCDEDGFATIVDRAKELVITGGFNVSPSEVERVLITHEAIADAVVVGRPHPKSGETVVAVITLKPGKVAPSLDELRAFAKRSLAAYKVPRELHVVDSLPRSILGKVLRKEVKQALPDD